MVSTDGVNRFWGEQRGQVYWPISLKRLNQNEPPFPITNGVQCTNAYSQIHYIHTFLNRNVKHTGRPNVKIGVSIQANFSKTTERKETPVTGIQVRLKLSSNQQTNQKSVHSTWRYSNIKVPYQMAKEAEYSVCRAKIDHLNLQ